MKRTARPENSRYVGMPHASVTPRGVRLTGCDHGCDLLYQTGTRRGAPYSVVHDVAVATHEVVSCQLSTEGAGLGSFIV